MNRAELAVPSPFDSSLPRIVATAGASTLGDAEELLRERLTVFYGYFALLAAGGALTGQFRRFPAGTDPGKLGVLLGLQAGHAAMLCALFALLRFGRADGRVLRGLDLLGTISTSAVASVALCEVPQALTIDVTTVAFFILFFALRAALLPSKPWLATATAAVAALPFLFGLENMYARAGVADPTGATWAAARAMLGGVAGVYVVSASIYGLRRAAHVARRLGQYVIHEKIGEGGMGTVYRASHALLKRPTAVKLIAHQRLTPRALARFEREAAIASRLSHPNNIAVYDFGRTATGVCYYAMELLEGEDLSRLVEREGAQSVSRALPILGQVAAALTEAHAQSLVHGDVKPANVMLCRRAGQSDFVKVLDFGLARDLALDARADAASELIGTPLYLAPESITDPEQVGPAADVYGLGCIAYFLLTARPPFACDGLVPLCFAHLHHTPEPPSLHAPDFVPSALDDLVLRCLHKSASERPSMAELTERLADLGRP